jgi:hypothetical protein
LIFDLKRRNCDFVCDGRIQIATILAVYANWGFADMKGIGWKWAAIIWIYSIVTYLPLDVLKFITRYILSGKAWNTMLQNKVRKELSSISEKIKEHSMLYLDNRCLPSQMICEIM